MLTRIKSSPIKALLMLLLMITLLFIPTTHAKGETNIDGTGGNEASLGGILGGWNDNRAGYRLYVINESNTAKSPVLDIWFTDDFHYGTEGTLYYRVTRGCPELASQWDRVTIDNLLEGDMPKPWINGTSNWVAVDAWLREVKEGEETSNAERAIEQVFGKGVLDEFRANKGEDPYYLCVEGLANFEVYYPGGSQGNWKSRGYSFMGTFYNFCDGCYSGFGTNTYWETGNVPLKSRTNETFARSLMLQKTGWSDDFFGKMTVPVQRNGVIKTDMGLKFGYDIAMYRISDITMNGLITTYDEPMGTNPAPAPKPETDGQKGIYSIVKVYATQQSDDPDDLIYDGCYTRLEVCKNIDIEDEPEYKVREWHVSRVIVETPMPFGTTWPICKALKTHGGQEGTGTGTVVMDFDNEDRTLFVLLVKPTDEEEVESDLIIQESEISIYRQMSEVNDFNLPDRKIKWLTDGIPSQTCDYQVVTGSYQCETPETCTSGPSPHNLIHTIKISSEIPYNF